MGGVCSFFFGCCSHNTHDPKGTTLVKERGCTDKLLLLAYIAAWVISVIVISTAANMGGNPNKIIKGIDYNGDICGYSSAVKYKPVAALVNPLTTDPDLIKVWVCLESCEKTKDPDNVYMSNLYGSTEFFGYCIPTFDFDKSSVSVTVDFHVKSQFDDQFDSTQKEISRGISDLANAWSVILMSAFFALFFSYVYMWLTKKLASIVIWLCIILVIVGGFFVGFAFLNEANNAPVGTSANRIQAYRVAGYVFIALTAAFVLIILGLSSQIKIAIEVVKEGSRAINDMKLIVFFPLIPLLICGGYMVYWIYGALFIFSVSSLEQTPMPQGALIRDPGDVYHTWQYYRSTEPMFHANERNANPANLSSYVINTSFRPLAAYHVFHFLWSVQFLVYFSYMCISGAVCGWYFTLSDENGDRKLGVISAPISSSVWRTIRYHLGTVCFASLIIAIVNFIRITVKYLEMKTRTNPPNYLQKAIFCLIQCCLKCIECCLDKISKNALVWCAMWGDPFLSASCSSFALIWRNLGRVAAVHVVGDIILGIGKVAIAVMTVGMSALILNNAEPYKSTVSSAFVPCLLIGLIAYTVAWLFFLTFETVIDTTFLCFLVDSENNEKSGGKEAMFASRGLQELVGKYQLRSAMEAETEKKEAAELYKHLSGNKVQDEHAEAVAHLNRAITAKRGSTGDAQAFAAHEQKTDHKAAWGDKGKEGQ